MQVEGLEEVERAFVHVDYALRAEPEHKVNPSCFVKGCILCSSSCLALMFVLYL